jgi:uncharacterized repeat protein (TIGR01451 family)
MIAALFSVINASGQQAGEALLTVGKDVQSATVTQVTYAIVVRNQGTAGSTNVTVRDTVPTNTTFESSNPPPSATTSPSPGAASCNNAGTREDPGTTCQWNLGNMAPGATSTILATFNLNQSDVATYTVTNSASASDSEGHSNSDSDATLTRARLDITDDTWVDDAEPPGTNHGQCADLRVLQDNRITSYAETDALPAPDTVERLFGAQLRAQVLTTSYTQPAPGAIGAHRITSGEWTEGSGTCAGTVSSTTTDPRTGAEPTSAATATATTQINQFPQISNWDVTADLDDANDRGANFNGWELRDQAGSGTEGFTRFHSHEASDAAQRPKLFLVFTTPEAATCLDADPETDTNPFGTEHLMTAFVTDGVKVSSTAGGDACNGAPVAVQVEWELEDDDPDAWFSSQEGTPTTKTVENGDAKPDAITTTSDENGLTGAGIRQDDPVAGENRIEVRIIGSSDPDEDGANPDACVLPTPARPPGTNCTGETDQVDDVRKTWNASGATSTSPGTTSTTTASPTGSASPSGSPSTSPSTSPSGTASASPSQTGSPSGTASGTTTSPSQSSRTISLFASSGEVVYPAEVTLSGQIISPDSSCEDAGEFVRVQRRILGESQYSDFASQNTDANGRYEMTFEVRQSAEYIAIAPRHDQCADATSSPESVLVQVKVTARAGRQSIPRGDSVGITGRVRPDHDGTTVLLQRRKGSRFVTIASAELNARSRFRFVVTGNWRGRRVFRVLWRAQDDEHETNNSRNVVIRTTRG